MLKTKAEHLKLSKEAARRHITNDIYPLWIYFNDLPVQEVLPNLVRFQYSVGLLSWNSSPYTVCACVWI